MTKVAVVILNYNGSVFLKQFIPTLIKYSTSEEIDLIVADNASTDDSTEVLKDYPEISTILLDQNHGYAGGYNVALKQIEAEYYLLLNSDVEVTQSWITPLVNYLDENPETAAAQPKLLDFNKRTHFEYAGASGGYLDALGYPFCRGRILSNIEPDHGQYNSCTEIFWASGASFLIRSTVFHNLGGFEASFFAHMEEIDLCWRIRSAGLKVAVIPKSIVYHVGGGTLNKTSSKKTYLNFRNGLRLLTRNHPKGALIYKLPIRFIIDFLGALYLLRTESIHHFRVVIKAQYDAMKYLRKDLEQKSRSYPTHGKEKVISIVLSYYALGKKKFDRF